ncbi:mandelate racemase/muconate lactonizing enzyme family protein [Allopusillimonas ginsengisoli]|uniref:mandelate racemase/muconate lactonizing enzyme family protein n=1 Tax=Allopusillimonas ginsengisoli TaxID=453575 RepID=UPI0010227899|nr:enolase C-terminal domain-like protein [Allopusillimonas ginsengisoli]TEA79965.1 hypothetical protein ERE07_03270 [Allopusillimonas ginsengisoli]
MKISNIEVFKVSIPVKGDYRMATGVHTALESLVIRLISDDGIVGIGEAHQGIAGYTYETIDSMYAVAQHTFRPALIGTDLVSIEEFHSRMEFIRIGNPFVKSAFETAAYDLLAKQRGISIAEMLGGPVRNQIQLSGGIGIDTPERLGGKLTELVDKGYKTVKIKIGTNDIHNDIACVIAARKAIGDNVNLRVDCNSGYTTPDAVTVIRGIAECNVEHLEQPVSALNFRGLRKLRSMGVVPILADESAFTVADVMRCIEQDAVDAVKIKITKVGGYINARRIIELCQAADLKVILGQGLCSSIEASAEMQLACAFAQIDSVGEMVGPAKLSGDLTDSPIDLSEGKLILPPGFGMGTTLSEAKLKQYSV